MRMLSAIKYLLPKATRGKLRMHWQDRAARQAFRSAQSRDFSGDSIAALKEAWGNAGFEADCDYLCAVRDYARQAKLAILECGTGLTTALMAGVAKVPVYSLEHSSEWAEFIDRRLRQSHLSAVVCRTRLHDYGHFDWYEVPISLPHEFDLVVCDGPPSTTRGGRYGLAAIVGQRIQHAAILLDDAERAQESEMISRWETEFGFRFLRHHSGYAVRPAE
jgi:hypothetical protein